MRKGLFITAEGMDGSGKTTQIRLMEEYIKKKGLEVVLTREPGGTAISEKIRSIILDPENTEMADVTEMMLYAASRAQHVEELIKPSVDEGKVIICDRFIDSTYVYQGFGRGIDINRIEEINRIAMKGIFPDITLFFDLSPEIALKRRLGATAGDRIENENMEFHMKVYEGYKRLAHMYPERIKVVDASREAGEIFEDVKKYLDKSLEVIFK